MNENKIPACPNCQTSMSPQVRTTPGQWWSCGKCGALYKAPAVSLSSEATALTVALKHCNPQGVFFDDGLTVSFLDSVRVTTLDKALFNVLPHCGAIEQSLNIPSVAYPNQTPLWYDITPFGKELLAQPEQLNQLVTDHLYPHLALIVHRANNVAMLERINELTAENGRLKSSLDGYVGIVVTGWDTCYQNRMLCFIKEHRGYRVTVRPPITDQWAIDLEKGNWTMTASPDGQDNTLEGALNRALALVDIREQ